MEGAKNVGIKTSRCENSFNKPLRNIKSRI